MRKGKKIHAIVNTPVRATHQKQIDPNCIRKAEPAGHARKTGYIPVEKFHHTASTKHIEEIGENKQHDGLKKLKRGGEKITQKRAGRCKKRLKRVKDI